MEHSAFLMGSRFKVQGCGTAHFVILSGEKRRMLGKR